MYMISNWYWIIGGDEANVWSSARAGSVPIGDPDYETWLQNTGYAPTNIATMEELETVFAKDYPGGSLTTYNADARWRKEQGGLVSTAGFPIKTDDRAQAKITGAYTASQVNPAVVTPWHAADGTVHDIDGAGIDQLNRDLLVHINNCFSISQDVIAAVAAGTITTREEIDAAYAAQITQARRDWLKRRE